MLSAGVIGSLGKQQMASAPPPVPAVLLLLSWSPVQPREELGPSTP